MLKVYLPAEAQVTSAFARKGVHLKDALRCDKKLSKNLTKGDSEVSFYSAVQRKVCKIKNGFEKEKP